MAETPINRMATSKRTSQKSSSLQRLREQAEAMLRKRPEGLGEAPAGEMAQLLHELTVYQSELEIQNEELRRVHMEVESSRDRFVQLYDHAPVGYLTLDSNGVVLESNLTAASLLGLDRRVLVRKRLSRFVAPESQDHLYLHLRKLFNTTSRQICELELRPAGGPVFTGRLEMVVMPTEAGAEPACLVALSDVTRYRQAENALQESQARLAGIVRLAMDAIILVDSRQRIVLFNEAAEIMFGRAPAEVMGEPLNLLIPKRFHEAHTGHMDRFGQSGVASRHPADRGEIWGLRTDGTEFPVEASISQMEATGKKFFTVILRDITSRLEKEKALRNSEAALADFFGEAPLGLLWVSRDGRILRINRAQLKLLGRASEEVLGQNISKYFVDSDLAIDTLERLAQKETVRNCRVRFRARSGTLVHVLVDANGFWEGDRLVHTRWFVRDVTWRLVLEREILRIGEREQQRLGQELHDDLCQQLSSIEYLAHSLARDLSAKSKTSAARATEITRMVREANTRTRELSHGLFSIPPGTEGLIGALEDLARRTTKVFQRDCRFHCPEVVRVDEPEVRQHLYRIAQEAVGNAIKHGKAKRIDIELTRNGNRLILGVRDDGLGIPKKRRSQKGMGLRLMQYRAEMVAGSIVVQHVPQGGTSVVCCVPDSVVKSKGKKDR
jgi:PAS domain S-box-containing protein